MKARGKLRFHRQPRPSAMVVIQMSPVVLRLALNAGGAGGLRRGFGIATDLGLSILVDA